MRKFIFGSFITGLLIAVATVAMPVRASHAVTFCDGPCPVVKKPQQGGSSSSHPYWVACIAGSAVAEMIGSAIHHNDQNDPRQSTLFEAGWYAAVCPVLLPVALLISATCQDNKATYEIARQGRRYGLTHPSADWTPFTNAYAQACRDGTLSSDFLAFLRANGLRLSSAFRRG